MVTRGCSCSPTWCSSARTATAKDTRPGPVNLIILVERLADAVVEVYGEAIREQAGVVLQEILPAWWGIGGRTHPVVSLALRHRTGRSPRRPRTVIR
jgi:Tautomerase enzyme